MLEHQHLPMLRQFVDELPNRTFADQKATLSAWLSKILPETNIPILRMEWRFGELGVKVEVHCEVDLESLNKEGKHINVVEVWITPDPCSPVSPRMARLVAAALVEASAHAERAILELHFAAKGRFPLVGVT